MKSQNCRGSFVFLFKPEMKTEPPSLELEQLPRKQTESGVFDEDGLVGLGGVIP